MFKGPQRMSLASNAADASGAAAAAATAAAAAAAAADAFGAAAVAENVPIHRMLKDYYTMGIGRFYHLDIN